MNRFNTILVRACIVAVLGLPAVSQTPPAVPSPDFEAMALSERALRNISQRPDAALQNAISTLFQMAPDGQLTQSKLDIFEQRQIARGRAQVWAKVLAYDLDGDLAVSGQEIERLGLSLPPGERAGLVILGEAIDANRDGSFSRDEIAAYAQSVQKPAATRWPLGDKPMQADLNKDGVVTSDEVSALIRTIAESRPRDPAKPPSGQAIRERVNCGFPKPSEPSHGVFLTAHEGAALSDVAVAGQGKTTTVARIRVPESKLPLYLLAGGTTSVIWAFEGHVEKIERIVLRPGDAVAGVAAEKITFVDDMNCVPRRGSNKKVVNGRELVNILRSETGIIGARTHTPHEVGLFDLSSGQEQLDLAEMRTMDPPVRQHRKILIKDGEDYRVATPVDLALLRNEREYRRLHPNGLISLDPEQVVAATPAERYDILPSRAGIKQLLEDGRLRPDRHRFIITRALPRLPSDINGSPWVFYMPPGIKLPAERSQYLSFRRLSDGTCIAGQNCTDQ